MTEGVSVLVLLLHITTPSLLIRTSSVYSSVLQSSSETKCCASLGEFWFCCLSIIIMRSEGRTNTAARGSSCFHCLCNDVDEKYMNVSIQAASAEPLFPPLHPSRNFSSERTDRKWEAAELQWCSFSAFVSSISGLNPNAQTCSLWCKNVSR